MERIYIGGLDPPRLSVKDVSSRLRSIAGVNIVWVDDCGGDKSFFFVNAKRSDEAQGVSAIDLVAKQYNNVKWKGCKLSVEGAKPHFLERLAAERQQREQQEQEKRQVIEHENDKPPSRIPRNLRIRQRFKEEAYCVDSKPHLTGDWSDFSMAMARMRKRRENYRRQLLEESKGKQSRSKEPRMKPFLNRAVHLVFNGESIENVVAGKEEFSSNIKTDSDQEASKSSTSDDNGMSDQQSISEDDSGSRMSSESENSIKEDRPTYAWSDEDSDDSSNDGAVVEQEPTKQSNMTEEELQSCKEPERQNKVKSAKQYVWSSDEDDSSSDSEGGERSQNFRQGPSTGDEFAAGLDLQTSDEPELDVDTRDESSLEGETKSGNLQDDVKTNLEVLSKLFPDMSDVAPNLAPEVPADGVEPTSDGKESTQSQDLIQPGWEMSLSNQGPSFSSNLGMMQRYDPTKESAKKYVVSSGPTEASQEGEDKTEGQNGEQKTETMAGMDMDGNTQQPDGDTVYEQMKLENIFKQSREQENNAGNQFSFHFQEKDTSVPLQGDNKARNGGSFAFSFDLANEAKLAGNEEVVTQEGKSSNSGDGGGTFAFSFDLGAEAKAPAERTESTEGVPDQPSSGPQKSNYDSGKPKRKVEETVGIRRRGLSFPKSVLEEYEEAFYAMNEGTRIREDLEGFRNDRDLRNQWLAERHSLTQDWKRKRKYAQSRMQKKMKFR